MSIRQAEIPIDHDLRDELKKAKRELTYSQYLRRQLKLKKESAQTTNLGDSK